jgi:hypothetical protein
MIDLTPIINAVIALLAAIVTWKLVPWIKMRTSNEEQALISALVRTGVFAAEQLYKTPGMGQAKFEYVQKYLLAHGYQVDQAAVEAAVAECINGIGATQLVIEQDEEDEE